MLRPGSLWRVAAMQVPQVHDHGPSRRPGDWCQRRLWQRQVVAGGAL